VVKENPAFLRGSSCRLRESYFVLLQLLEIIFTFWTVKLGEEEDPVAPVAEEEPAPGCCAPEVELVPEADEDPAPMALEEDADPLSVLDPVIRTSCPTCALSLEVSPVRL
jgi:hypothetical protein